MNKTEVKDDEIANRYVKEWNNAKQGSNSERRLKYVEEITQTQITRPDAVLPPSPVTGGIQCQNMAYDIPPCPVEIACTSHSSFATG